MVAYELTAFGAPLQRSERETPVPQGKEVLLRITSCGVCHSDVHLADGYYDLGGGKKLPMPRGVATFPHVLGHEIVGEVVACGPEADVQMGSRAIAYPWIGCGECIICERGDEHLCTRPRALGITALGGYADHVIVPDSRYLVDVGGVNEEFACTLACAGITAYAGLTRVGRLEPEERLAIFGAGGVGLIAISLAERLTGVKPYVVETNPARREAALAAGAADAIDPASLGDSRAFSKRIGGRLTAAIDFVGAGATAALAFENLTMGGTIVSIGLLGGSFELPLPMVALRGLTIRGSYVGTLVDLRAIVELAKSGDLKPTPIEMRPLASADEALSDLRGGRVTGRVVLKP